MKGQDHGVVSTIGIAEILTGFYLMGDAAIISKVKRLNNPQIFLLLQSSYKLLEAFLTR